MTTYRIIDGKDKVVDELEGLSLSEAEQALTRCLNGGVDCWLQEEPGAQLDPDIKRLFVREWNKEYKASVMVHQLQDKIDVADMLEKPTKRLRNQLNTWQSKADSATKIIVELVSSGVVPENAVELCAADLGDIAGYVGDCYRAVWLDYKPVVQE